MRYKILYSVIFLVIASSSTVQCINAVSAVMAIEADSDLKDIFKQLCRENVTLYDKIIFELNKLKQNGLLQNDPTAVLPLAKIRNGLLDKAVNQSVSTLYACYSQAISVEFKELVDFLTQTQKNDLMEQFKTEFETVRKLEKDFKENLKKVDDRLNGVQEKDALTAKLAKLRASLSSLKEKLIKLKNSLGLLKRNLI